MKMKTTDEPFSPCFDPEGIAAISRGLSNAIPPVSSLGAPHPEGMPDGSSSRRLTPALASLQDARPLCSTATGGVALLNPRLMAAIPSGSRNLTPFIALLVGVIVFVCPAVSRADDAAKTDDVKQDAAEKKEDRPKEPSLLDKLSKELLKEIDDDPAQPKPEQKEDKFERVAKGMRSASEKLDGKETGDETTKIQEQVIRDLDELIKQLQNPPPNGGGGGGGGGGSSKSGGGGSSRQQRAGSRGGKGQPQGGTPKQQAQGSGSEQGGQDRKNAEGSDERTDSERKAAAEAARRKKLEIDVWGHLPPHLRGKLLSAYGERMLPKYEQLVRQFYEALSEQNEAKPRR